MSVQETLEQRRAEFEAHVWNHSIDPFQASFDFRRRLSPPEIEATKKVVRAIAAGESDEQVAAVVRRETMRNGDVIFILLQLAGLTRNKILSDLRAATAGQRVAVPNTPRLLPNRPEAWKVAGPYLAKWLRGVLEPLATIGDAEELDWVLESLNQATWPGWIRQERAKRQGHEAEHRLAVLLASLALSFEPAQKADNPLCPDVQIHSVSFDLVVPSASAVALCFKSTVQTSNIGQFGESKGALEVTEAGAMLRHEFRSDRPILMAMVDGVGFRSNRAGLDGILDKADEFCQFSTVWKAAVVAANVSDTAIRIYLPAGDADRHSEFLNRYAVSVGLLDEATRADLLAADAVEAGEALAIRTV